MSDNKDHNVFNDIQVPYIVHEDGMSRLEHTNERLYKVCILLIILLIGTNAGWMYYESQFEDVVVTNDVDTGTGDATVTGVGDINYGESKTDNTN